MTQFREGMKLRWMGEGDLKGQSLIFIQYLDLGWIGRLAIIRDERGEAHQVSPFLLKGEE